MCSYPYTKVNFKNTSSNSENPKMEAKTSRKIIAFRYHNYEYFCSQINLTKLTIVKGEPDNINKKSIYFLDAIPLKM